MTVAKAQRLILLAPVAPSPTGNGLAMRIELFRRAAPPELEVETVVVPLWSQAGVPERRHPVPRMTEVPIDPSGARRGLVSLVGDPVWRERLRRAEPLPPAARVASPGLAQPVAAAVGSGAGGHGEGKREEHGRVALHVMRAYLAPLGLAVADRVRPVWMTLDLDDDDAAYERSRGEPAVAAAYERLLSVFGPAFDGICAASPVEAEAISRRAGLPVETVPNGVDLVAASRPAGAAAPENEGRRRPAHEIGLLFVGNLIYGPNVEAAGELVRRILPRLQARVDGSVSARLVGRYGAEVAALRGPGVELMGHVEDLAPLYASADCAVVALSRGGGTRIKVLEAFAHGVPVVAYPQAAAGLAVQDCRHLLLADGAEEAATAIGRVISDPALANHLTAEAGRLVEESYSRNAVGSVIRSFFARAASRAQPGSS